MTGPDEDWTGPPGSPTLADVARPKNRSASSWEHSGPSVPRTQRVRRIVEVTLSDDAIAALGVLVEAGYGATTLSDGSARPTKSGAVDLAIREAAERIKRRE